MRKLKMYKALVKDKTTKKTKYIVCEQYSLKAFRQDIKNNGYSVVGGRIATKEKYDYILENTDCNPTYFSLKLSTIQRIVEGRTTLLDLQIKKINNNKGENNMNNKIENKQQRGEKALENITLIKNDGDSLDFILNDNTRVMMIDNNKIVGDSKDVVKDFYRTVMRYSIFTNILEDIKDNDNKMNKEILEDLEDYNITTIKEVEQELQRLHNILQKIRVIKTNNYELKSYFIQYFERAYNVFIQDCKRQNKVEIIEKIDKVKTKRIIFKDENNNVIDLKFNKNIQKNLTEKKIVGNIESKYNYLLYCLQDEKQSILNYILKNIDKAYKLADFLYLDIKKDDIFFKIQTYYNILKDEENIEVILFNFKDDKKYKYVYSTTDKTQILYNRL